MSQVTLPRLGQGMESGTIVRWLKQEGDRVEKGEPLYELDTEKVTQEVEADSAGVLLRILAQEGEEIEVGKAIAVIGDPSDANGGGEEQPESEGGADVETETEEEVGPEPTGDEGEGAPQSAEKPAEAPKREPERRRGRQAAAENADGDGDDSKAPDGGARAKASPLARRIAKERGIDLASVSGTGPDGRVVAEDVERAAATPAWSTTVEAPAQELETVKLTGMRRTIARRMSEAWQTPHFQISMSADMRAAIALREALVARVEEGGVRPTFSDVLTKACAVALMRHRDMNALFAGDEVQLVPTANVGIAVAIPHGLVVPVITGAERRAIAEIAEVRTELVERTRAGKLQTADLEGGTFTISNLGMFGVERFVAVLNPPQAGILAVGAIEEKAVVEDGEVAVRPRMDMTLSCDHRTVDGATASRFLAEVKAFLEQPGLML